MVPEIPEVEVYKNFPDNPDNVWFFDKGDDLHGSPTLRALQQVRMIHLLNQPGPVLPHRTRANPRSRSPQFRYR